MKTYEQLDNKQKERAVNYALKTLADNLVEGVITMKFKKYHEVLETSLSMGTTNPELGSKLLVEDKEINKELVVVARIAAESSFYADQNDHVIVGVL